MMLMQADYPHYFDAGIVVCAATGRGLNGDVAAYCRKHATGIIAVNDAVRIIPQASILYAADTDWWNHHRGVPEFEGSRWSVLDPIDSYRPGKLRAAMSYGINLLLGRDTTEFSTDRSTLTLGNNSGLQAINLAMHFGAKRIVLVGYNMEGPHFFGPHPLPLRNSDPLGFLRHYNTIAESKPANIEILNATPNTFLNCFPKVELKDAFS